MGFLSLWNPFSPTGRRYRIQARDNLKDAQALLAKSAVTQQQAEMLYEEHREMADKLRGEMRRNHFAELFQRVPPRYTEE